MDCIYRQTIMPIDASDAGELGVGLTDGPLCDVNEIEVVLQCARLAWVQSVRATGKPKAPSWIMKERGLRDYYDALGGSDGFERATRQQPTSSQRTRIMRFGTLGMSSWKVFLFSCGWNGERTEEPFDSAPGLSTTYLSWWAFKPREIIKRFRARLRKILLEAGVKVKSISRAKRQKEEIERLVEGFAGLTGIAGAKRIKPPTRMAKTAGAKKSSFKRASKRKSAR